MEYPGCEVVDGPWSGDYADDLRKEVWIQAALQKAERVSAGLGDLIGTKFADDDDSALPILSPERLFGYTAAGWSTTGCAYPHDRLWLAPNLAIEHGAKATRDPEKALREYLSEVDANLVVGHMLASATITATRESAGQSRSIFAHAVGTLQRLDGASPSEDQAVNVWGEPTLNSRTRGQQGLTVIRYAPDGRTDPQLERVEIVKGSATYRGEVFRARCDSDGRLLRRRRNA